MKFMKTCHVPGKQDYAFIQSQKLWSSEHGLVWKMMCRTGSRFLK